MAQQFISAIGFLQTLVYNTFYYSFKIGQFIIFSLRLLVDLLVLLLKAINVFLLALSESFSVFSVDVSNAILQIAEFVLLIIQEFQKITNIFFFISETVVAASIWIHTFFHDAVQSFLNLMTQCMTQSKRLIELLGFGVWFSITLIPFCIYNLVLLLASFISQIFHEIGAFIIDGVKNCKLSLRCFFEFITNVQIETVIGLIVTVIVLYIFSQFYMLIFTSIYQKMFRLFLKLRRLTNRVRQISFLSLNTNGEDRRLPLVRSTSFPLPQNKNNLNNVNDDRYCVICNDQLKCILLLPCRHVCMCSECNIRLQVYDDSCPVCRIYIEDTMRIFI